MPTNKIILSKYFVVFGLMASSVACVPEKQVESSAETGLERQNKPISIATPNKIMDEKAQKAIAKLQWVQQFDLKKEIEEAIKIKDFRLFVIAKRGPNVPGINLGKQPSLKEKCGEKYLQGIGDIQYGDAHKELYNKAIQLASDYNKVIVEQCETATSQE